MKWVWWVQARISQIVTHPSTDSLAALAVKVEEAVGSCIKVDLLMGVVGDGPRDADEDDGRDVPGSCGWSRMEMNRENKIRTRHVVRQSMSQVTEQTLDGLEAHAAEVLGYLGGVDGGGLVVHDVEVEPECGECGGGHDWKQTQLYHKRKEGSRERTGRRSRRGRPIRGCGALASARPRPRGSCRPSRRASARRGAPAP